MRAAWRDATTAQLATEDFYPAVLCKDDLSDDVAREASARLRSRVMAIICMRAPRDEQNANIG